MALAHQSVIVHHHTSQCLSELILAVPHCDNRLRLVDMLMHHGSQVVEANQLLFTLPVAELGRGTYLDSGVGASLHFRLPRRTVLDRTLCQSTTNVYSIVANM